MCENKSLTSEIPSSVVNDVLEKYDTGKTRKLDSIYYIVFTGVAVIFALFHLYTSGFGLLLSIKQRSTHWLMILIMMFLYYPISKRSHKKNPSVIDMFFIILSIVSSGYLLFNYNSILLRGAIPDIIDTILGITMIGLTLEATRRSVGKELLIICLIFILYAIFGRYAPGVFMHKGYSLSRLVSQLYLTTEGIFGIPLDVSATYMVLFIIFGAILKETGLDSFFRDVSLAIAGRITGGPAQVAVVASGLFGTINGSATSNVVSTGTFTIPLMKSVGYSPYFAGAAEAVASTGGQLMPPIMGSAAFIMAEVLGIPYLRVALAAFIPAILYYFSCSVMVYFRAKKLNLRPLENSEIPSLRDAFKKSGHMLIPIALLIVLLMIGRTPLFAAFYSIVATIVMSYFKKDTRLTLKKYLAIAESTAKSMIGVASACAAAGIIIGIVSLTGIGLTLGNNLVQIASGNVLILLLLTVFVCLIMGMGVPTTVVYILMATIAAPPLITLGIPPLAAHLFVFYFGLLASVTPPVAIAAYAAAGLANASPSKTGWQAFRLASAGFIIPFIFIFSPKLLFIDTTVIELIIPIITSILGVISLGASIEGFLVKKIKVIERIICFIAAICLIVPETISDITGLLLFISVYLINKINRDRNILRSKSDEKGHKN
jgi:TRAP transporter 4TM/12TM fusion protein